jgi:hypothetical protein
VDKFYGRITGFMAPNLFYPTKCVMGLSGEQKLPLELNDKF